MQTGGFNKHVPFSSLNLWIGINDSSFAFLFSSWNLESLCADEPLAPTITLSLKRGPFGTYHFVPAGAARALVLFGSGDGGWGLLENRVCSILAAQSIYTVGIDCNKYAE